MPGKKDCPHPRTVAEHAQSLWIKAHDSAVKTYGEGQRSHRVAFAALKHEYEKSGDHWQEKKERGPSDPQAARGPTTRISRPTRIERRPPAARSRRRRGGATKAKEARREYAAEYRKRKK